MHTTFKFTLSAVAGAASLGLVAAGAAAQGTLQNAQPRQSGFERYGEDFVRELTAKGMRTSTTVDFLAA